jgi:hypothetical protein
MHVFFAMELALLSLLALFVGKIVLAQIQPEFLRQPRRPPYEDTRDEDR